MATRGAAPPPGLLRGSGYDLGPYATRYPPRERTMLRLLAEQAESRPDHPWLVVDGTDTLTFAEAHALVRRVGRAVRDSVGPGRHVALLLRNQIEFFPAFYGAMAGPGVAVPLNADARGPLLGHVLAKSDAALIIARTDLLDRLADLPTLAAVTLVVAVGPGPLPPTVAGVTVVPWADWLDGHEADGDDDSREPGAFDMALIQFTSGTTGTSKGAIYPHHFLYLYSAMISDSLGHGRGDVLSTPLPAYHVAALHIIANSALHAGCTAHLKSRFSAREFWPQIAADEATFAIILGPMAAVIAKTAVGAPAHRLKGMFCVPPPPDKAEFEERYAVRLLWQGYGMTEVYPLPMRSDMLPDVPEDTLGYPVSWMDYGVVDPDDQLVPPATLGEIVFRPLLPHAMVAGYYRDPAATVAAFRNFAFHTGDVGYYDEDGCLHYRGRMQERIRRRGENISAAELEYVALRHDLVMEAAAYGVPSELGEHDVKLDVVLLEGGDLVDLHGWLSRNVPRYMVPRYLERRSAFPKTPSERVEKYKLAGEPLNRPEVLDMDGR